MSASAEGADQGRTAGGPAAGQAGRSAPSIAAAPTVPEGPDDSRIGELLKTYGCHVAEEKGKKLLTDSVLFRELARGELLRRPGENCARMPLVLRGSLRVFKASESGREIELYRIGKGDICLLSCASANRRSFPAFIAAAEASLIAGLRASAFDGLLALSPGFRDFVLGQYGERLAGLLEIVDEVAFRHLDARLKDELAKAASGSARGATPAMAAMGTELLLQGRSQAGVQGAQGTELAMEPALVTVTHQELADRLGTSREVVSRILKDWEEQGVLRLGRGRIELLPAFYSLSV